ncbi:uncharacterized protein B0T15DRAFT_157068 [Chaetomium strumarium]|uniref:CCHC-type domain-containing protein n=1 Tax=Chaetomium strumarium TaxID=1170767 RepID=A0AAJ0M319_9PEZI|nr:hypothetical protein B0T15DRAFT_157068 [Chaetomium strumarium]
MDDADKKQQNLEILGLKSLGDLSLSQLLVELGKRLPSDVSKKRILSICTMWLHPRLMTIDISSFHDEVGIWYRFLKDLVNDDLLILETFNEWQRDQATQDPTSLRRLRIAEDKLRSLMSASDPMRTTDAPESGDCYGQMHPDRLKLSQKKPIMIELEDDDEDVVFISSNPVQKNESQDQDDPSGQPDLSFLTGANSLVMSDVAHPPHNKKGAAPTKDLSSNQHDRIEKAVVPLLTRANRLAMSNMEALPPNNKRKKVFQAEDSVSLLNTYAQAIGATFEFKEDMVGYQRWVCQCTLKLPAGADPMVFPNLEAEQKRGKVGKPTAPGFARKKDAKKYAAKCCVDWLVANGHSVYPLPEDCPRNFDTALDRKPPKDYKCYICGKVGNHFRNLCPRDPRPDLWRRYWERKTGVVEEAGSRHGSAARAWDDPDSRFDDSTRLSARSVSPVGEVRKGGGGDSYRPESDLSRLRLLSSHHQLGKRKASRSPSRDDLTSRGESRDYDHRAARKEHRRNASFLEDLVNKAKARREGRLSYDDEVDEDEQPGPLAVKRTAGPPSIDEMQIDRPKTSAFKKRRDADHVAGVELFESDLFDMIRGESVKTDRLLLINGRERRGPYNPLLVRLFSGKQNVWVNDNLNTTRPCALEFFDLPLESKQQVEISDFEMAGESAMTLVESDYPVATNEEDAMMVDAELKVAVDCCFDRAESTITATGSRLVRNDPSDEANSTQMGVEPLSTAIDGASRPEVDTQESTPAAVKNSPDTITVHSTSSADGTSKGDELMRAVVETSSSSSAVIQAASA